LCERKYALIKTQDCAGKSRKDDPYHQRQDHEREDAATDDLKKQVGSAFSSFNIGLKQSGRGMAQHWTHQKQLQQHESGCRQKVPVEERRVQRVLQPVFNKPARFAEDTG
jgi:hypothetical protein